MNIAAPLRRLSTPRSRVAPPVRLSPALSGGLAALLCLCFSTGSTVAAETEEFPMVKPSSSVMLVGVGDAAQGALLNLRVGRTLSFPLPAGAKYSVIGDAHLLQVDAQNEVISVKALNAGRVVLEIELPARASEASVPQKYSLRLIGEGNETVAIGTSALLTDQSLESSSGGAAGAANLEQGVITAGVGAMQIPPRPPAFTTTAAGVETAVASAAIQTEPLRNDAAALLATLPRSEQRSSRTSAESLIAARLLPETYGRTTAAASRLSTVISSGSMATPARLVRSDKRETQIIARAQMTPAQLAPVLPELEPFAPNSRSKPAQGIEGITTPLFDPPATAGHNASGSLNLGSHTRGSNVSANRLAQNMPGLESPSESEDVVVSPPMQQLGNIASNGTTYPLREGLPPNLPLRPEDDATSRRPLYRVTQGMARILAFKSNILSVFFSDDNVMDARAINARTIGVTGKGPGKSTLAVFLSRYPNDVIGRAVIYNIEVYPASARAVPVGFTDAVEAENAIRTALNDPRIRVSVLQRPDGSLVAQLSGGVRNSAEAEASVATASLFVPNVISSLYADPQAPTLEAALRGPALTGDEALQAKLRSLYSNDTIELVALPNGTALKATVDNAAQAESILSILPSLSRQIQPFIVVRGATGETPFYSSERPILHGEDYEMTRRMNEVTGVSSVYVVRTARNALAVYGTARSRVEYDTVRRYATTLLPQLQESVTNTQVVSQPAAAGATPVVSTTATTTSVSATAPALSAAAGVAPAPGTANLTGLTSANAVNSGYQAPIQLQMFVRVLDDDAATIRLVTVESNVVEISRSALKDLGAQFGSATVVSETVDSENGGIVREIDPTFNLGTGLLGDFAGFGAFSNINPIRVRLAALMQNGSARVLSKPNLTAVEGAEAQITIGGVRPIPFTASTGAAGGTQQTSVEFRRYGIILTMRPTVTDDETIILQIRGDVTDLDPTTAINLGGAEIPGERVRSVDTVVTMREGDTLVLGGLITNDTRKQTSKVPILGDIPILGALFRSKRFENNESELAIFLTPRIRRQRASMNTKSGVEMVPSLPSLPNLQDSENNPFALTTSG